MDRYVLGVDIGGTLIKIGILNETGNIIEKWSISTDTSDNGKNILTDIAESINEKIFENCLNPSSFLGMGVGVPGPVTEDGMVINCPNIGWENVDAASVLKKLTSIKTCVLNDANSAALGEVWNGAARGCKNVVMVTLGTGVGGGIVVNGNIIAGSHGGGGEIGHMPVNPDETVRCGCGKCGCFEQYASATGIVRLAKQRLKDKKSSLLTEYEEITAKAVFDSARMGDEVSEEAVNEAAEYMGRGFALIASVVDPEIFVIGGGVSGAGEYLLKKIKDSYYPFAFKPQKNAGFVMAKLGNDAGITGAAKYALDCSGYCEKNNHYEEKELLPAKEDVAGRLENLSEAEKKTNSVCAIKSLLFDENTIGGEVQKKIDDLKNNPVVKGAVFGEISILNNDDVIAFSMEKYGQSLIAIGNIANRDTEYSIPGQMLYIWLNTDKKVDILGNTVKLKPYQFVVLEFYPGDELPG